MGNALTRKIIFKMLEDKATSDALEYMGFNVNDMKNLNELVKASIIVSKCIKKMKNLNMNPQKEINLDYQVTINYLFNNLSDENREILANLLEIWGYAC
jgi:hypothetical protein